MFDGQLDRLDAFAARHGRVDCVFFGASPVLRGIDPEEVARAFEVRRGRTIACFNFGLIGLTSPKHVSAIADLLVERVQPRLLVWGTHVLQVAGRRTQPWDETLASAWFRHRRGDHNAYGWLLTHSRAAGHMVCLLEQWRSRRLSRQADGLRRATESGFSPVAGASDPEAPPRRGQERLPERVGRYDPSAVGLPEALDRLRTLQPRTQVLILQMPSNEALTSLVAGGDAAYDRFARRMARQAADRDLVFQGSPPRSLIPDDAWADLTHLNAEGARVFSSWVGEQLASEVARGVLRDPTR